jgi:predicted secreted protein
VPALAPARRRVVLDAAALAAVLVLLVWPFRNDVAMPWSDEAALAKPDPAFFPGAIRPPAAERVFVPGDRMDLRLGAFVRQGTFQQVRVLQDYEPLSSRRLAAFLSAVAGVAPPAPDAPSVFGAVAAASLVAGLCGEHAFAQASRPKALQLKDLPAHVQKTVQETLKGGAIKSVAKEQEDGIEQYEIESTLNGKLRDFNVAADGRLLVVEEATTLDAIPAAAKAAIQILRDDYVYPQLV